jgi:hypothetical protein
MTSSPGSALGRPSPAGGCLKDWARREITPVGIHIDVVSLIKTIYPSAVHLKEKYCYKKLEISMLVLNYFDDAFYSLS